MHPDMNENFSICTTAFFLNRSQFDVRKCPVILAPIMNNFEDMSSKNRFLQSQF